MRKMILLLLFVCCGVVTNAQGNNSDIDLEGTFNEVTVEQTGENSSINLSVTGYKGYYLLGQYGSDLLLSGDMLGEWNITHTDQYGEGSVINLYQSTAYNKLYIYQNGQNHNAQITQDYQGIYEDGYNRAYIYQDGISQSASIQQLGYENIVRIYQDIPKIVGYNKANVIQEGFGNSALIKQSESHNVAEVIQQGDFLQATVDQVTPDGLFDTENEVNILQTGWTGEVYVYQDGSKNYVSLNQRSSEGGVGIEIIQTNNTNPLMGHSATIDQGVGWDGSYVNQSSTWSDILNLSISGEQASARINQTNGILLNKTKSNLIDAQVSGRTAYLDINQGGEGNEIFIDASGSSGVSVDQSMALRDNLVDLNVSYFYGGGADVIQNGYSERNVARINQSVWIYGYASIEQSGEGNVAEIMQDKINESEASILQSGAFLLQNKAVIDQIEASGSSADITQLVEGENNDTYIEQTGSLNHASVVQEFGNVGVVARIKQAGEVNNASVYQYGVISSSVAVNAFIEQRENVVMSSAVISQISVLGNSSADILQYNGTNLYAKVDQALGVSFAATIEQYGSNNTALIIQTGIDSGDNVATILQGSSDNTASVLQSGTHNSTTIAQGY